MSAFDSMTLHVRLAIGLIACASPLGAQTTWRVSARSDGVQGSRDSSEPSLSSDGRFVAFSSLSDDLVLGDTNGCSDVFVHDRATGQTVRVSIGPGGRQGRGDSRAPSISADGRFVAFESQARNLDGFASAGIFVHDRALSETSLVSVDSDGVPSPRACFRPSISADGRFVAFESASDELAPGDANGQIDVYVHDRETCATTPVSRNRLGRTGNAASTSPALSGDGRYVAFASAASNLVFGDTNGERDVFVLERSTGVLQRASVNSEGRQADGDSYAPAISADGRFVAFVSDAVNLLTRARGPRQVFVRDREAGQTRAVSVDSDGRIGNRPSGSPVLSPDGRFVAFTSAATNLVANDTNGVEDVFLHDIEAFTTVRVSVTGRDGEAQALSYGAAVSEGGAYVAFVSRARNLTCGDTNQAWDVFVRELAVRDPSERVLHADADGDGYGNPVRVRGADESDEGFVADASDCDDADPNAHPGADERYDGTDDDCDGEIDEDFAAPSAPAVRSALGCTAVLALRAPASSTSAPVLALRGARNRTFGFVVGRPSTAGFVEGLSFAFPGVRTSAVRARGNSDAAADCSGTADVVLDGVAGLGAGAPLRARYLGRDPETGRSSYSNELWFVVGP